MPKKEAAANRDGKSEIMKRRICDAVIKSLDMYGYAGTSVNTVQKLAGISRGALTHHFPTKQELIAETGNRLIVLGLERLEKKVINSLKQGHENQVEAYLMATWDHVVHTREGKAFSEILMAMRTDAALATIFRSKLDQWRQRLDKASMENFDTSGDGEAAELVKLARIFMRGLLLQEQYGESESELRMLLKLFAGMVAKQLLFRPG